ncbi:hypothetical protein ACP70R_021066 [Stipagrostis hirtigluma subsp. patula]
MEITRLPSLSFLLEPPLGPAAAPDPGALVAGGRRPCLPAAGSARGSPRAGARSSSNSARCPDSSRRVHRQVAASSPLRSSPRSPFRRIRSGSPARRRQQPHRAVPSFRSTPDTPNTRSPAIHSSVAGTPAPHLLPDPGAPHPRGLGTPAQGEIEAGNRPLGLWTKNGWKNIRAKYEEKTSLKQTKIQLKNKLDNLKKEFTWFMEFKNCATGLGWNEAKQTVDCSKEWWAEHLAVSSAHDTRILNHALANFPSFPVPPKGKYYLVDSGYPNRIGYLAPFKGSTYHIPEFRARSGRPPQGKYELFNFLHSSLRNVIERAFGVLKQKWRILKGIPSFPIRTQKHIIIACMALHNFIRDSNLKDKEFERCDADEEYVPGATTQTQGDENADGEDEENEDTMNTIRSRIADALLSARGR